MSEGLSAERLAELERVWEADPSSRAFVQLAEEYRRLGDLAKAAGVLQKGLESHPHYLSALVALGRCRVELGDATGAIEVLDKALVQDPAQLVANKLLVEAHLSHGDPDKARERLDFYRLFNDRDEEIEALEQKIEAAANAPDPRIPLVPGTPRSDEVFDLGRPATLPPIELGGPSARPGQAPQRPAEPFGALHDAASAGRRISAALATGGVFAVAAPAEPQVVAAPPPAQPVPEPSPAPAAEAEAEEEAEPPGEPAAAPPWGTATSAGDLEQDVVQEVVAEPFRPRTIGEEVERETIEEPFDEVLQAPSVGPRPLGSHRAVEPAPEAEPEPEPRPEPEPSSTLGELYLSQGHLDEAAAEFRRVLSARPDDPVASSGLREIERRRGGLEDTAAGWRDEAAEPELEARAPETVTTPVGGGLTRKKVATLRSYLERLKRGRESADVS